MVEIKKDIYITRNTADCLNVIAYKRTKEEIATYSQELYIELKRRYRLLNKYGAAGEDSIIHTVERVIGKTEAVVKIAEELGLTIICENKCVNLYRNRKEDINVMSLGELENKCKLDGKRFNFHTVLVDEPTDAKRVRAILNEISTRTFCPVNLLGVQ